jgi:hypothetical protein
MVSNSSENPAQFHAFHPEENAYHRQLDKTHRQENKPGLDRFRSSGSKNLR